MSSSARSGRETRTQSENPLWQAFLKVPPLHVLAPTRTELPFAPAQLLVLVVFATVGTLVTLRNPSDYAGFRPWQFVNA